MTSINKAVIAIAGKGKRMFPITKAIPKEMLPIGTTPILQIILCEVIDSGIKDICLIISRDRQMVANYLVGESNPCDYNLSHKKYKYLFDQSVNLSFVYQESASGTANAVKLSKDFCNNEPFALLYGDDLFVGATPALKNLIDLSIAKDGATVLGVQHIDRIQASKYATINCSEFNGEWGIVDSIIEKQRVEDITSDLTSVGRYVLSNKIFNYIDGLISHNGEFWITDAIESECKNGLVLCSVINSVRHDAGSPSGYIHAFKTLC